MIALLYTFNGKDMPVSVYVDREAPVAICPLCGLAVVDAPYVQEHLNWHAERLDR